MTLAFSEPPLSAETSRSIARGEVDMHTPIRSWIIAATTVAAACAALPALAQTIAGGTSAQPALSKVAPAANGKVAAPSVAPAGAAARTATAAIIDPLFKPANRLAKPAAGAIIDPAFKK
jgi:hypothetical protein